MRQLGMHLSELLPIDEMTQRYPFQGDEEVTLAEAMRLRNHVLSCLELAARSRSPDERQGYLTFLIAGGGPTGVEYAGALCELLGMVLGRDYPELDPGLARILLVEGQDRLLGARLLAVD